MNAIPRIVVRALVLVGLACAVGLVINEARSRGLPLLADEPYQIYVPCPVVSTEAAAMTVGELPADLTGWILIDSRQPEEFALAHPAGARLLSYHPLESPAENVLAGLRREQATGILVIGDTAIDSGRLLGAELAGAGLRGVHYLQGGFEAWHASGRPVEKGQRP